MNRINGAAPIVVDWQLNPTNRGYRVTNVIVSSITMASMQRSDLVSIIQRNGGIVQALLAALREKNASNGIERCPDDFTGYARVINALPDYCGIQSADFPF